MALWGVHRAFPPVARSSYRALSCVACSAPILSSTCLTSGTGTRSAGHWAVLFRFFLVTTIILVPQALAIHGFEPDQIGPAVIWTAASFVPLALLADLLLSNVDPRLLLASGFAAMAVASLMNAGMTSAWAAANFDRTEFLMGFGQCSAFIGLVAAIILQGLFSGGLVKPQRILTFCLLSYHSPLRRNPGSGPYGTVHC